MSARLVTAALWAWAAIACGRAHGAGTTAAARGETKPEAVAALARGARALGDSRRLPAAERWLRKAVEIDPMLWEAHYDLGLVLRRKGALQQACASFERAQKLAPEAPTALLALAECEHAQGYRKRAEERLAALVELTPESREARIAHASVLRELGQHERALAQVRHVLIRDPSDVFALLEVARIYRQKGKLDVADLVLDKAGQLDAKSAEVALERGLLGLTQGDTQVAFEAFARAAELDPHLTAAHMNRGAVLLDAGDFRGAEQAFRAALARGEDRSLEARLGLAVSLRGQGAFAAARAQYEKILARVPSHAAATFDLAILHADFLRQPKKAVRLFERYLQIAPSSTSHRATAERYLEDLRMASSMNVPSSPQRNP